MRAKASPELIELLAQLRLATPRDVRVAGRHARRLAKDLALFDSVWVDALVQARRLTPFQAAEINAGRGAALRVGPYVLLGPLSSAAGCRCYRAREHETNRPARVTLFRTAGPGAETLLQLKELIRVTGALVLPNIVPIEACGLEGDRLWVASPPVAGRTAAEWLIHSGRLPPPVVLEIARQMTNALAACEGAGLHHGDISAEQLVLEPLGSVQLVAPGLRPILRPDERAIDEGLAPETFNYLAPERLHGQSSPSTASELHACGALWWHLLSGRAPRAGVTAAARREAAAAARIRPIHPLAPDTPPALAAAIARCTDEEPSRRPASFAELADMLGPAEEHGAAIVARHLARGTSHPQRLLRRVGVFRRSPHAPTWTAAAIGVLLAVMVGSWPLWRSLVGYGESTHVVLDREQAPPVLSPLAESRAKPLVQPQAGELAPGGRSRSAPAMSASAAENKGTAVARTSAVQPTTARVAMAGKSPEFVISAARPVLWNQVRPLPGQTVRGRSGERPRVVLPPEGGKLAVENLRFEDVDFVMPQAATDAAALLRVTARRVSFHRCSFRARTSSGELPAALVWSSREDAASGGAEPAAQLQLEQCTLANVGDGIRCLAGSAGQVVLADVLFLGAGAMVSAACGQHDPQAIDVRLRHCTVRGALGVCAVEAAANGQWGGLLNIEATDCVFAPDNRGALLLIRGPEPSAAALACLRWKGEGCMATMQTPYVLGHSADGQQNRAIDAKLVLGGVVRTELGFAAAAIEEPDASRLVRWRVPLRSGTPPGISDAPHSLPSF